MKRVAWLTDIHLNFVSYIDIVTFADTILKHRPDVILIGGDIGEADSVVDYLMELQKLLEKEICFVLGNHDFYKGSISAVQKRVREVTSNSRQLSWLPEAGIIELTPTVGLVGHGSWADGRLGDYEHSDLLLNDHFFIEDFNPRFMQTDQDSRQFFDPDPDDYLLFLGKDAKHKRLRTMQSLADKAARHFQKVLLVALKSFNHVLVLTHVPPFREASWYGGKISDDNWLPHFSCKAVGDVLYREMKGRPEQQLTVLCGHTHGSGEAQILENLKVFTGGATYGRPELQRLFEFD
jgi:Icc protein